MEVERISTGQVDLDLRIQKRPVFRALYMKRQPGRLKVQLSKKLDNVRDKINIKNVIKALDVTNGRVADRLEVQTLSIKNFLTLCKDPSTYAKYPACKVFCPNRRLSVKVIGQLVRVAVKPKHSRPITHDEFIQLCTVLLSMIDPKSYVTIEPMDRKIADKARKFCSLHYVQIREIKPRRLWISSARGGPVGPGRWQ
eukprot:6490521-Amphidinium_carterae.2